MLASSKAGSTLLVELSELEVDDPRAALLSVEIHQAIDDMTIKQLKELWDALGTKFYPMPPVDVLCHLAIISRAKGGEALVAVPEWNRSILRAFTNTKFFDPELLNRTASRSSLPEVRETLLSL